MFNVYCKCPFQSAKQLKKCFKAMSGNLINFLQKIVNPNIVRITQNGLWSMKKG